MITSVRLERFKNFRDATLALGPFTVLVGTNASGKSNLRDAFRFLHGMGRGYSLAEIIGVLQWKGIRGGTREIAMVGEQSFQLGTGGSIDQLGAFFHDITVALNGPRGPKVAAEFLSYNDLPVFELENGDTEAVTFAQLSVPSIKTDEEVQVFTGKPCVSQHIEWVAGRVSSADARHLNALHHLSVGRNAVVGTFDRMRFHDLSPEAMKVPSLPGQTVLGDRGENLSSVLQAICEDSESKRDITEWIRELTPLDVVDFEFIEDQTGKILVSLVESNGRKTSAYSASDGTLRFLAMIAALLGPDSSKFYFLEELDTGIHPTRLHLLIQLIEQHASAGKVQVVATTHSPQLLAMLSQESQEHASLVYRLEGEQEGHIRRIVDIPEARRVLKEQNLSRLHEAGWLEDAVAFNQPEADHEAAS